MAKDLKKPPKKLEKMDKRIKKKKTDAKKAMAKVSTEVRKLEVPFILEKRPQLKIDERKKIDGKENRSPEHRLADASISEEERQKLENSRLTGEEKVRDEQNRSGTKHTIYPPNRGPPVYNERKPPLPGYGGIQGRKPARRCSTCGEYHLRCDNGYFLKRKKTIEQDRIERLLPVKPASQVPNAGIATVPPKVETLPPPSFRRTDGEANASNADNNERSGGEIPPPMEEEIPCEPRCQQVLNEPYITSDSDGECRVERLMLKRNESIDTEGNCVITISDSEDNIANNAEIVKHLKTRSDSVCGRTISDEGNGTYGIAECGVAEESRVLSDMSMDYVESDYSDTHHCHVYHCCNRPIDDWADYTNESSDTPQNDAESKEEINSNGGRHGSYFR
jgi:hypothetical protein